jgi:Flp pilus assembly protein TadD
MISTRFVKLAASSFAIGLTLTGGHAGPTAQTESATETQAMQLAAKSAGRATAALAGHDYASAISAAEDAVAYQPRDPQYRILLGQAYLSAGRFASAETSFSDVLTLSPDNARAALNLALAEIALGKRDNARSILTDYSDRLSPSDFGLASALAGDVEGGVRALESAIRGGSTDAKTRQNLALAYAMAGKWANARVMAEQDLSASDADARISQWASFVTPQSSADQVASLLGVQPVAGDAGQPTRLALNALPGTATASVAVPVMVQQASANAAPMGAPIMAQLPASARLAAVEPAPVVEAPAPVFETTSVAKSAPKPAPAAPVIHAAPVAMKQVIVPAVRPVHTVSTPKLVPQPARAVTAPKVASQPIRRVEAGKFVVQLGAFQTAAISRDAWRRLSSRYSLGSYDPANASATVRGASYIRLSVGGFVTRAEAIGVCVRIRNAGGSCFVRGMINDAPAYWVQRGMPKMAKPIRMASR